LMLLDQPAGICVLGSMHLEADITENGRVQGNAPNHNE